MIRNRTLDAARPLARAQAPRPGVLVLVLGGPVLVLAAEIVAPSRPPDPTPAQDAAFVVAHSERLLWSGLLGLLAGAVLAAGVVVLATRFRGRGRAWARTAAGLVAVGAAGLTGHAATELLIRDLYLAEAGVAAAVLEAEGGVAVVATVLPMVVGVPLGVVLMAVAGVRSGRVRWWVVAVSVLAFVVDWSGTRWATEGFLVLTIVVLATVAARADRRE